MTYVPWYGSPEHTAANAEFASKQAEDGEEAAHDAYNLAKADYLDRAEREIERLNAATSSAGLMDPALLEFYVTSLNEIVSDGTAEGALTAPFIILQAALARDLLESAPPAFLDESPAAYEFITGVLNRHSLVGLARDLDHEVTPAPQGLACEACGGLTHLDQHSGRFVHHVGTMEMK